MSQWQKCVGSGREAVGTVKERVVVRQRQWAFSVVVAVVDDVVGAARTDMLTLNLRLDYRIAWRDI
jgi:hypothetical protein